MRRRLALAVTAAFAFAPASMPGQGWADARKRIAVLDVVIEGPSPDVAAQFEATVEEQLKKSGYDVVSRATTADVIAKREDLYAGCAFGPCVTPIARELRVDRLIDIRVAAEGQTYNFVVSMVEGSRGASVGQVVTSCAVCTVAEALSKMTSSVRTLEGQLVETRAVDSAPIVSLPAAKKSKLLPALLIVSGLVLAGGGAAVAAGTDSPAPGWVGVGSGGTLVLTGIVMLASDD